MYSNVFISYAKEDRVSAEKLFDFLELHGYDPWLDKRKLLVGQQWDIEINRALKKADFVILLLSKISIAKRGYLQREFKIALDYSEEKLDSDIFIIPIKIDDCEIPENLKKFQWIELINSDSFGRILEALNLQRKKYVNVKNINNSSPFALKTKHSLNNTETNILELCVLMHKAEAWFHDTGYIFYTFGEKRRILAFLFKLKYKLESRISLFSNSDEYSEIHNDFVEFYEIFSNGLSEANYVLPLVRKEQSMLEQGRLKEYRYTLSECAEKILEKYITNDSKICSIFDELKHDEKFPWNLFGYENIKDFREVISPNTETLLKNASIMEIELIKTILEKKQFYETEMLNEGFDYEIFCETTNSLARDKYIISSFEKKDNVYFELTKIGEKIIRQLLDKKILETK